jgi:hypothetical protein
VGFWKFQTAWFLLDQVEHSDIPRSAHTAVFIWFVWIWEQTAIISLYSINWLVFCNRDGVFVARYGLNLFIQFRLIIVFFFQTVPLFGRSVAVLSRQKPGFEPKTNHVKPVMDQVALAHVSFLVLQFSLISIIPTTLHTHLQLHVALNRRTNERILGTFHKQCPLADRGTLDRIVLSIFSYWKGYGREALYTATPI